MMDHLMNKVREVYAQFDASHDFQHIERVYQNALAILHTEPTADVEVVKIAVLLHDVSDKSILIARNRKNSLLQSYLLERKKSGIFETVSHKCRLMVEMS